MPQRLLRTSRGLIVGLGLLPGVLASAAYFISSRHLESVHATVHATRFLRDLDDLQSTLKGAESSQRGYILTFDPVYLQPYTSAREAFPAEWDRVAAEGKEENVPAAELAHVRELADQKWKELEVTIHLRATAGYSAALAEVKTNRGQAYMNGLRQSIRRIRNDREAALRTALATQYRLQAILDGTLAAGVLGSLALVFLAYRFTLNYENVRDRMESQIRQLVQERTTELEARTQELERRTLELQRSNADLGQFAYSASHDLQEPLRTIASYVGLLDRKYGRQLDDTARSYIGFAISGAQRMQTLIADLLSYSRSGTQPLELAPVPMYDVVGIALENLAAAITQNDAEIKVESLPVVPADSKQMALVWQNLLGNAIKFRQPDTKPQISISASREGGNWIFSVRDNGIGFEEKYVDRIFQVFQRLHSVGKYQGTGIGLAICRRIVEHHGGKLWATSHPESGSTFYFSLPANPYTAQPT